MAYRLLLEIFKVINAISLININRKCFSVIKLLSSKLQYLFIQENNVCMISFFFVLICRIIGAVLIVAGLYIVMWGKGKERNIGMEKSEIPGV